MSGNKQTCQKNTYLLQTRIKHRQSVRQTRVQCNKKHISMQIGTTERAGAGSRTAVRQRRNTYSGVPNRRAPG